MIIIDSKNVKLFNDGVTALRKNICNVLNDPDNPKSSEAFLGTSTDPTLVSGKQPDNSKNMKSDLGDVLDSQISSDSRKTLQGS